MQRFKILVGATLLLLTLFFITNFSVKDPISAPESEATTSVPKLMDIVVDENEAKRYRQQQQELKVAIKAYFDKAVASGDIVGAGVSIVKGDSIVISDGFGKRNVSKPDKVDGETVFRLGSLSKGFAGVLAADLKSEGKLDWKDKISDYLPEFQLGDASNTYKITLGHILSHTSGTPYHSFTNLVEAGLPMATIAKRFKEVKPISEPGVLYSYQNAMFALCGEVMRKATGQEVTESLYDRFFKPLGMCTTTTDHEALVQQENVAMPHVRRRKGWKSSTLTDRYYNAVVAGGINANAHDMGKWMRLLLGHNPEILNKSALQEAFEPFIALGGHNKYYQRWPGHLRSYYGFGWRIHKFATEDTTKEMTIWHHGGSVNNYRNEVAVYPEADLGICVLLNSNSRLARTVIPDLHKIVKDVYARSSDSKVALNNFTPTSPTL